MNMNAYSDYRFFRSKFLSESSEKVYNVTIAKDDRFFTYMKKYFIKGKVQGQTHEPIDEIVIEDPDKTFFSETSFTLDSDMLASKGDVVCSFTITIKRIRLRKASTSKMSYKDGKWILNLYELEIPYKAVIDIKEKEN